MAGAGGCAPKLPGPGALGWPRGGPGRPGGDNGGGAVEESLLRLGTDRIDLLQLHWPDRCGVLVDVPAVG